MGVERVIRIDPMSDPRWDPFVKGHPAGCFFHQSAWGAVLERSFPHVKPFFLALVDGEGEEITGALPLYWVNHRFLGGKLVSVPFSTYSNPLIQDRGEARLLLEEALGLLDRLRTQSIEILALEGPISQHLSPLIAAAPFEDQFICLDRNPEALFRTFHKNAVRKPIEKAMSQGFVIRKAKDEADLKRYYAFLSRHRWGLGLPVHPYAFFHNIWSAFSKGRQMELVLVEKDHRLVAGQFLFKFRDTVLCEFAATDAQWRKYGPAHLMDWQCIQNAVEEGYKIYDLGRTPVGHQGLLNHKRRWGSQSRKVMIFSLVRGGQQGVKSLREKSLYQRMRRTLRFLPFPVFQWVSHAAYRYFL